jgi:hypothetical protein
MPAHGNDRDKRAETTANAILDDRLNDINGRITTSLV